MWFFPLIVYAQQRPLFTQNFGLKYYDNPAYGGMKRSLQADFVYRDQYSGLDGQPSTIYAGFHLPLFALHGGGGFHLMRQEAGLYQSTQASASYNYVIGTNIGFLSFGGRFGVNHVSFNGEKIRTPDGNYEGTINHNDPLLNNTLFSGIGVIWELGMYVMSKNYEGGMMVYDIPEHQNSLGLATYHKTSGLQLYGQYKTQFLSINIMPNVAIRTDFREVQTDVGIMAQGVESFFGGLNIRGYNQFSFDALCFIIGTNIGSHYTISYSYDLGLSNLRHVNDGTHEIVVSYNLNRALGMGISPKIIRNPRHL